MPTTVYCSPVMYFYIARMPSRTSRLALSLDSRIAVTVSSPDLPPALFLCRPPSTDIGRVKGAFPLTSLTTIGSMAETPNREGPCAEKNMNYSTSCLPDRPSPNKVATTPASISTRGVGRYAGEFPETAPILHRISTCKPR
jgi:hypothetical protein